MDEAERSIDEAKKKGYEIVVRSVEESVKKGDIVEIENVNQDGKSETVKAKIILVS